MPGFGPCQFGGPPGHMGAVQSGKAQVKSSIKLVIFLVFFVLSVLCSCFHFGYLFFDRLVHPRYQVLRCLIPVGPMAPVQLLPFCFKIHLHHYRNAMIPLLGKWALVIGPLLMIPLKLATDCPIITQLLLQALLHHRRLLQMGRIKMTPALSEWISGLLIWIYPAKVFYKANTTH